LEDPQFDAFQLELGWLPDLPHGLSPDLGDWVLAVINRMNPGVTCGRDVRRKLCGRWRSLPGLPGFLEVVGTPHPDQYRGHGEEEKPPDTPHRAFRIAERARELFTFGGRLLVLLPAIELLSLLGIAFENSDGIVSAETRIAEPPIGPGEVLWHREVLRQIRPAELSFQVGFYQSDLVSSLEHIADRLLSNHPRNTLSLEVSQDPRLAEPLVIQPRRGESLGELAIIEVTVFAEAPEDCCDIASPVGPAAQFVS
jgi:hypothetical protein